MLLVDSTIATTAESSQNVIADAISTWTSEGFIGFLQHLAVGILIIIIGKILLYFISKAVIKICEKSKKLSALMGKFISSCINVLGWFVIALTFFQELGVNVTPVIAGLGVSGIILGLAFQETLSNLFSGVMIVVTNPYRLGDYIDTGAFSGTVSAMELMTTTLTTPDNKRITLMNKLIWQNPIVNYSDTPYRRVDMSVNVPYETNMEQVKNLLMDIINKYPEVVKDPAPAVEINKLDVNFVTIVVRPWTLPSDYWTVYWRMQGDMVAAFKENGINVPYPKMNVQLTK